MQLSDEISNKTSKRGDQNITKSAVKTRRSVVVKMARRFD